LNRYPAVLSRRPVAESPTSKLFTLVADGSREMKSLISRGSTGRPVSCITLTERTALSPGLTYRNTPDMKS
jgi:hypothetical protein